MEFLTFQKFISIPVLIIFYYFGALILPFFMWIFATWVARKYKVIGDLKKKGKDAIWNILNAKQKAITIGAFAVAFIFMELFWRMLFEFLIAYMQMRDALLQ